MLRVLDRIMKTSSWVIKAVTFDAHRSNAWIRDILFGQCDRINDPDLDGLEWIQALTYKDLPDNVIPNIPLRLCFSEGSAVFALPGVCCLDVLWCAFCFLMVVHDHD